KLSQENHDVFLIDKDPVKIRRINEELDIQALLGSGTSPNMLKKSGIKDAGMLVAATDSDEVNLIACLLAQNINPYIIKVARIRNSEYIEEGNLFRKEMLNIDQVINPESVIVDTIMNLMTVPGASDVVEFEQGRIKLVGMIMKADSPFLGRKLLSFKGLENDLLVGSIIRGERAIIPDGEDTFQVDDLVYFVTRADRLHGLFEFFNFKNDVVRRVIIVGAGETGTALAKALDKTKMSVKIIDKDEQRCISLAENLERVIVINGDGTDRNLLVEENVNVADYFITLTGNEESNVLISLMAKRLGVNKNVTRINNLSYIPLVSAIGLYTIVGTRLSAIRTILQYIRRGNIISVVPLKGEHAEAIEVEALDTSDIVNVPLAKVNFPKNTLVGAVIRNTEIIVPNGDTIILPKDRLIIFTLRQEIKNLEKLLTVKLEYF
ncbi:Trk system potassium transporter TrkA, partial [Thermodesulfobacteriota bacterium]